MSVYRCKVRFSIKANEVHLQLQYCLCSIKTYMRKKSKLLKPHVLKPILKGIAVVIKNKIMLQKPREKTLKTMRIFFCVNH